MMADEAMDQSEPDVFQGIDESERNEEPRRSRMSTASYSSQSSMVSVDGDGNRVFLACDNAKLTVTIPATTGEPEAKKPRISDEVIQSKCQKKLRAFYSEKLCKIRQFPGSKQNLNMDDIYTNISMEIELTQPGNTVKMPITDHLEMLERTNNNAHPKRLLVIGEGGSGKSTLTAKIAYDWINEKVLQSIALLFVLNMRQMRSDQSLEEAVFEQLMPNDLEFTETDLIRYINDNQSKVMFILDSYDEFARKQNLNEDPRTSVIQALSFQMLTNSRILVTSRPWRADEFSQSVYTKYEVTGFTEEQVEHYVNKFFKGDPGLAASLMEYLKKNDFCPGIASVPLMTQLFCIFWRENGNNERGEVQIPKQVGQLYTRIITTLLSHRKSKQGTDEIENQTLKHALTELGKIAFTGLWPPEEAFIDLRPHEDKLVFSATEIQENVSDETTQIALEVGLLSVDENMGGKSCKKKTASIFDTFSDESESTRPKHLRFFHKTIQEKCAGEFLATLSDDAINKCLGRLTSVKLCLSVKVILQFACGARIGTAELIMKKLEELYQSNISGLLASYYQDELCEEDVRKVQQFIEMCLICNYESGAEGRYGSFLNRLFPNGQMRFLGMSAHVGDALEHFLKHRNNVRSLTVVEMPRAGTTVYYLAKSKVLEDAHRDVHRKLKQEEGDKLDETFHECVQKGVLKDKHGKGLKRNSSNVSNLLADVQIWERFSDLQPSSDINFTPVIGALQYVHMSTLDVTDVNLARQCDALIDCIEKKHLSSAVMLKFRQIGLETQHVQRLCVALKKDKLPQLKEIDISRNDAKIPIEFSEAVEVLQMTHVNVSFMAKEADQMQGLINGIPKYGPNLRELRMEGNTTSKEDGNVLLNVIPEMGQLEYLGISGVFQMESASLRNLQRLRNLKDLRIWDIDEHLEAVLMCLAESLSSIPQLSYLSIRADEAPMTISPSLVKLFEALDRLKRMKRLLLLGIYFDQDHLTRVVEIGRSHNYNFLCVFRRMLADGVDVPPDDFIRVY